MQAELYNPVSMSNDNNLDSVEKYTNDSSSNWFSLACNALCHFAL